jgi:hypothetical protein
MYKYCITSGVENVTRMGDERTKFGTEMQINKISFILRRNELDETHVSIHAKSASDYGLCAEQSFMTVDVFSIESYGY